MRFRTTLAALALLTLGAADSSLPRPDEISISVYASSSSRWAPARGALISQWETELRQALKTAKPAAAAKALASRFGFSPAQSAEFTELWLYGEIYTEDDAKAPANVATLRRRFLSLIADTHRAPLVIAGAAIALAEKGDCSASDYPAMLAGGPGTAEEAWTVAASGDCASWYGQFRAAHPDRAAPALVALAETYGLSAADVLPVKDWLAHGGIAQRVAEADRADMAVRLDRDYLAQLLDTGLTGRAVSFGDSLDPATRDAVLADSMPVARLRVDGLEAVMEAHLPEEGLRLSYAAALALEGRPDEARAVLAKVPDAARAADRLACDTGSKESCPKMSQREFADLIVLDQWLSHPEADPYPMAEAYFSSSGTSGSDGALTELRCSVFAEPKYRTICSNSRWHVTRAIRGRDDGDNEADQRAASDAIAAASLPGYAAARSAFADDLAAIVARDTSDHARWSPERTPIEPLPPPFRATKLPAGLPAATPPDDAWLKSLAPLPPGYAPVRVGRDGDRVAVISVSQNYDPTGEVSAGGYWVHLSNDGGRSWGKPLYTGLAEYFPYAVLDRSPMPLFEGDTLTIAVDVALIDTRSITYPPVGLRSLRREQGLYLRVPIADLERDGDGDGITDLAARHLLIDAESRKGGSPYIVGSDSAQCTGDLGGDALAIELLIRKLTSGDDPTSRAIVEPVDRGADAPLMGWRGATRGFDRPVLIEGDPADYRCMRPERLMIVYTEDDVARMRRMTPIFNPLSLGSIVFNRAGDRGYVAYSFGWAGGTVRMKRIGGMWVFDPISSWIT